MQYVILVKNKRILIRILITVLGYCYSNTVTQLLLLEYFYSNTVTLILLLQYCLLINILFSVTETFRAHSEVLTRLWYLSTHLHLHIWALPLECPLSLSSVNFTFCISSCILLLLKTYFYSRGLRTGSTTEWSLL